jgi:hypothetical protein
MRAIGRSWLVAAIMTAVVALATAAGTPAAPPMRQTPTALGRTVELMEALKNHHYTAACEVYDPMFWAMVGFASRDCAKVLRKTFPRREPVAYRVHFGGRVGPGTAVVIVSMALGDAARLCDRPWSAGEHCDRGSPLYFELTQKTLTVDWRGRNVGSPQNRWYVSSIGGV